MNDGERPWRPGQGQKITALYAWVAEEPDGSEGVCSAQLDLLGRLTHMPLVGADLDCIRSLHDYAEMTRRLTGYPVRLVRYSQREDFEKLP